MSELHHDREKICQSCLSKEISIFHCLENTPVHSVLNMPSREIALNYPKGNISLGFCGRCGFVSNIDFDPELVEYSSNCEESQGFSMKFKEFLRDTATHLIQKFDLHNKDILEIGCGKGEFLSLLCELGENRGVGFDPAYVSGREQGSESNKTVFIKDLYSEKYANHYADFICCRMTLEHIRDTAKFLSIVRRSVGKRKDTLLFFQVPNLTRILKECAFEDIYYEHCSYFSPGSLARLFRKTGFEVLDIRTAYADQYIMLEAKPATGKAKPEMAIENDLERLRGYIKGFEKKYRRMVDYWEKELLEIHEAGKKAVVWGSGSKAVSFLTTLRVVDQVDQIEYVVDINPYRQGSYMAGTGQLIVGPEFLQRYKPDIIIIMNSIYCSEIQQDLDRMGLAPVLLELGEKT